MRVVVWLNILGSGCAFFNAGWIAFTHRSKSLRIAAAPVMVLAAIYLAVFLLRFHVPELMRQPIWRDIGTIAAIPTWWFVWIFPLSSRAKRINIEIEEIHVTRNEINIEIEELEITRNEMRDE